MPMILDAMIKLNEITILLILIIIILLRYLKLYNIQYFLNIFNYLSINNINNDMNINNMNNTFFNYQNNNKQCFSSKEKPNLSFLPLMQANQIKNNNNIFGYHRSFTDINISTNNRIGNGYNNSQEINKWIMRI